MASTPIIPHNRKPPPAVRRRRGDRVREFIKHMRQRGREQRIAYRTAYRTAPCEKLPARRRKRKAALALSAGVMGFSTAATGLTPEKAVVKHAIPGIDFRADASQLKVSEEMKEALAEEEGVRLTVYRDVAGYPTVGVGHLLTSSDGLSLGDTITYEQAIDFLEQDLRIAEKAVTRLAGELKLYQHEFDALVDLVYNVGEGNVSTDKSPNLNKAIAVADYNGIANELEYHHAKGKEARGLVFRSERRSQIFLDAAYDDPRPGAGNVASRGA